MFEIEIKTLNNSPEILTALSKMLVEVVARGGLVSFLHPLAIDDANAFWECSLIAVERGERIVLGAFNGESLVGTIMLEA